MLWQTVMCHRANLGPAFRGILGVDVAAHAMRSKPRGSALHNEKRPGDRSCGTDQDDARPERTAALSARIPRTETLVAG